MLSFVQWCDTTRISATINNSSWLFAAIEAVHLVALGFIGGAVLLVDTRLLGVGLNRQSIAMLARSAQPWLLTSVTVMIASGVLLFLSEPIKCYYSSAFWYKMSSLFLAIVFTFTVRQRVTTTPEDHVPTYRLRLVGLLSIVLWLGVGISGRLIGFQ